MPALADAPLSVSQPTLRVSLASQRAKQRARTEGMETGQTEREREGGYGRRAGGGVECVDGEEESARGGSARACPAHSPSLPLHLT